MEETELRRLAEKKRTIPNESWRYLEKRGYVGEALDKGFEDECVGYIVGEFDALKRASPGGRPVRTLAKEHAEQPRDVPVSLNPKELIRAMALEEYLAMMVACDADVYTFRTKVLDGHLLSEEEARTLVESPAAAVLNRKQFGRWEVPVIGHRASIVVETADDSPYRTDIHMDPPGITKTAIVHERDERKLSYPGEDGTVEERTALKRSVLGELHKLSEKLAKRYRWQEAQATWFVLTGKIPAKPPLTIRHGLEESEHHIDGRITLEVSPYVSVQTVTAAYRKAREMQLGLSSSGKAGRGDGSPEEKNIELLRFVIERTDPLKKQPSDRKPQRRIMNEANAAASLKYTKIPAGKELVKEWNELYPQWAYSDGNAKNFLRDFNSTRKKLARHPRMRKWRGRFLKMISDGQ